MAEGRGLTPRRPPRSRIAALAGLALAGALPVCAQQPPARDTARADTLVEVLPDSVRAEFGQPDRTALRGFPALADERGPAGPAIFECDEVCIRNSTAFSLAELVLEHTPGVAGLRPGYFAGPHHLTQGPYGPGFVELYLDGRQLLPLESAEADLRRISLAYLERVRVIRSADGLIVDARSRRHTDDRAYSRIEAGTGNPQFQSLRAVFQNGLGRDFIVGGAIDLIDVGTGGVNNDRFEALGRLSWIPGAGRFGLEAEYRSETIDRTAADTLDFGRRNLTFRARADPTDRVQVEAFYAIDDFGLDLGDAADDAPTPVEDQKVETAGLVLRTRPGAGYLTVRARLASGTAYPSVQLDGHASHPLLVGLQAELSGRLASWDDFSTSEVRGALVVARPDRLPVALRLEGATGTRGFARPRQNVADSVAFRSAAASVAGTFGPFSLGARYDIQNLGRALTFGAAFDSATVLGSGGEVDVTSWEVSGAGPLIPLGGLISGLSPVRISGFWREQDPGDAPVLYVAERLLRGQLDWHDSFFEGNLELWLSGFVEHRGARLAPRVGAVDPVTLSSYNWSGGHLMFRIGDFRFFWRTINPGGLTVADVAGPEFPRRVNVFGVKWEFFN